MIEPSDGAPPDSGMTLVEVLVAMGLFGVLASILLGLGLSTQAVTEDTRDRTGVNEEARIAMERIAREVRQSAGLDSVTLPGTPAGHTSTSFTFWTDFNNDGARTNTASDPEVMTYEWDPDTEELSMTAVTGLATVTRPVLAATVTSFVVEPRSSRWQYDQVGGACSCADGITTWRELDNSAVGNYNSEPDPQELRFADLLFVSMTVEDGNGTQTYSTQIDLRNRS
ncbi:hypothetical protein GCM10009844_12790 [Nocardioides koreensis]|uniref:Prepilin-type N-terminal cleavage/methylation domain-containing protein n=1 Tax=Nocardioides koreensis TaxID=433651 RepID=A0ABP5L587_9ACTN